MATKQLDSYADLTRPEHEAWKRHRNLLGTLTAADAVFRNCLGLALLVKSQTSDSWVSLADGRVFVQNANVSWASMTDVPPGYFQVDNARRREVTWASVRDTTMRFGVPVIEKGTEKYNAWDFRSLRKYHQADLPVLDADRDPQLFRCFNAMNWAMSSVAFNFNRDWTYAAPAFRRAVDDTFGVKHESPVLLVAGSGVYDGAAYPDQWMPKAYLGFKAELRHEVFDRATTMKAGQTDKYSYSLCDAFTTAMGDNLAHRAGFNGKVTKTAPNRTYRGIPVTEITLAGDRGEREVVRFMSSRCRLLKSANKEFKAGDVIAEERFDGKLPKNWHDRPLGVKWNDRPACPVVRLLGRHVDPVMRLWFDRQGVELVNGLVHYPSAIASVAALSTAVDSALFWEVSEALEYHRDDCDALVFPPLPIDRWFHMRGWLPGDVEYDVTPTHQEFISFEDLRGTLRARGPRDPKVDANLKKRTDRNVREREKRAVKPQ